MGFLVLEDGLEDSLAGGVVETAIDILAEEGASPEKDGATM